jgi:hypothetical protein
MASLSKALTVFDRSSTGIVGSNPARGVDVCSRISVRSLRRTDPPSKESYQMSIDS